MNKTDIECGYNYLCYSSPTMEEFHTMRKRRKRINIKMVLYWICTLLESFDSSHFIQVRNTIASPTSSIPLKLSWKELKQSSHTFSSLLCCLHFVTLLHCYLHLSWQSWPGLEFQITEAYWDIRAATIGAKKQKRAKVIPVTLQIFFFPLPPQNIATPFFSSVTIISLNSKTTNNDGTKRGF